MFGYALKHPIKKANHLVRNHRELTSLTLSCLLGRFQCSIFLRQGIQCPSECVPYMCSSNLFWLQLNILTCILVYTFPCSPMICQSVISCLCTPDQNWLHFSLSAALTISIMQPLHLQLLARQTESKSKYWIFSLSGTQCSRRCWRWAVLSFGGNHWFPKS